MTEHRVIKADYANWRPVAGRKVLQLILEVPIEETADVMEKLGVPMPGASKWVAVALLQSVACAGEKTDGQPKSAPKPSETSEAGESPSGDSQNPTSVRSAKDGTSPNPERPKKPFASLPLSQQAAIRCGDKDFQKLCDADNAEEAASYVRSYCGVASRSELDTNSRARRLWQTLEQIHQNNLTDQKYAGLAR